jgi:addiction module HigA family antidote
MILKNTMMTKLSKHASPGEILQEEFLNPLNITAYRLAKEIHIPQSRISDILSGKRGITADTAMRFAMYFGTTHSFG